MQQDIENLEQRQDRDRRKQEERLFLLLLALLRESANNAASALKIGADPFTAAADPLAGNTALQVPPAWPRIARRLKAADVAGYMRTVRVIPGGDPGDYTLSSDYDSIARQAAARLIQHAHTAIGDGIRRSVAESMPVRRAVRLAFTSAGLVESATSKAWLLETTAETLVGFAYGGGWFNGWHRPQVEARIRGFRYSSTLDSRTTNICRAYSGVRLPIDHAWWQTHWPLNHFGCRSVVLPIFTAFEATPEERIPWTPWPQIGFGHAPAVAVGVTVAA